MAFIEDLPALTIAQVGRDEIQNASRLLRRFSDQRLTLADAVGLHFIESRRLKVAWATDRHLGLTGAELIVHQK